MRIALVHSYYSSRQPSGENVVVDAQAAALRAAGHDVLLVAQRTDERERSSVYPIAAAWTVATGFGSDPTEDLRRFAPDVVHVHNLFPNFGTRWLDRWPGPVVATLHNFRPMCAAGTLYRDGATCTLCPDGDRTAALRHACYRDSTVATLPMAVRGRRGVLNDPVVHRADALVVLSSRSRDLYGTYGVDTARLRLVPNHVDDQAGVRTVPLPNGRWLFVGRLSREKGIAELVDRWPPGYGLDVVGAGPLAGRLRGLARQDLDFRGELSRTHIRAAMPAYIGLVFPGRCAEGGYPQVFVEALAAGLPVVALTGSSVADYLVANGAGTTLQPQAGPLEWADALTAINAERSTLSTRARDLFERTFTQAAWLTQIEAVYAEVSQQVQVRR